MKSSFQTILVVVFLFVFAAAVFVFSGLLGTGSSKKSTTAQGNVSIWGVLPNESMQRYVDAFNTSNQGYTMSYVEHTPANFGQDLIVALANGVPPDIVIISSELFSSFKDKLYTTPFAAYTERAFRDTNIDGAQLFLTEEGAIAMPLLVDPLVVYYNRDILAGANFVVVPQTWTDLTKAIPSFTRRNTANAITQSTLGLGQYQNVAHARDILSALFLQSGVSIIGYNSTLKTNVADLSKSVSGIDVPPAAVALDFYTSFSSPTNTNYSWNNALPNTLSMFLAGRSVFYIGRASELFAIQSQNPNLNFDVATLFQTDTAVRPVTYGSFIAAATLKAAPNPVAAYTALTYISGRESIDTLSKTFSLPPVRRDLLLTNPSNPYTSVFFKAALSAFSWPDPNAPATENIFRDMIQAVTSGRETPTTAIYEATRDLQANIR